MHDLWVDVADVLLPLTFLLWKTDIRIGFVTVCLWYFLYLVSLQVACPLGDRGLHAAALVPQLAVFLAEVLFLLQQGDVAPCQFFLINLQHRRLAQCFAQLPPDVLRVLLKGVQQVLMGETDKCSHETQYNVG